MNFGVKSSWLVHMLTEIVICLSKLKSCVKMISDMGCLGKNDVNRHWSVGTGKYFCLWWHLLSLWNDLEWSLWESCQPLLWYLQGWDCDLDLLCMYLPSWWWWEVKLMWGLCWDGDLWWCAGVPEGGILCGQSTIMCPYSSHSKHLTFGQCHVMCPASWNWSSGLPHWT